MEGALWLRDRKRQILNCSDTTPEVLPKLSQMSLSMRMLCQSVGVLERRNYGECEYWHILCHDFWCTYFLFFTLNPTDFKQLDLYVLHLYKRHLRRIYTDNIFFYILAQKTKKLNGARFMLQYVLFQAPCEFANCGVE